MIAITPKIRFKLSYMPVARWATKTEIAPYLGIADKRSFKLRDDYMFNSIMVAEAVAVHPDQYPDNLSSLVTAYVSSVPSSGNESYSVLMEHEYLADPSDLKKIFWMAGEDDNIEVPYVFVVYLTPNRKYLRKVKVTPEGVKVPVPSSLAVFNLTAASDGYINLPIPVKDHIAFNDKLEAIDIIEHIGDALNARIIVYHDLKEAVLQLMGYANHDRNVGLNGWVANWLNNVQEKIDADHDAQLAELKQKHEYDSFIKSLPPLSFTSSDTSQSDTSQGFKETVQRYVVIVIAMVVVFIIGHAIIELIKNTANTVAGN